MKNQEIAREVIGIGYENDLTSGFFCGMSPPLLFEKKHESSLFCISEILASARHRCRCIAGHFFLRLECGSADSQGGACDV